MDPISSLVLGGLLTISMFFIISMRQPRTSLFLEADRFFICRRKISSWESKMKRFPRP
jgi:hypothetical protein